MKIDDRRAKAADKRDLLAAKRAHERAHLPRFDDCRPPEANKKAHRRWLKELRAARDAARRLSPFDLFTAMIDRCPTMVAYWEEPGNPKKVPGWSPDTFFQRGGKHKLVGVCYQLLQHAFALKGDVTDNRSFLTSLNVQAPDKAKQ